MSVWKLTLAALALWTAGPNSAQAQQQLGGTGVVTPNGFAGGYAGMGAGPGVYGFSNGFGNYGLPGGLPGYVGNPLSGYGPGMPLYNTRNYAPRSVTPQTRNNLGGLMNTIQQQTGRSSAAASGLNTGAARRRRGR